MRIAIIDCGTNTFNLLIIDFVENAKYCKVYNTRISVKLGEGSINQGYIGAEPFNRGLAALGEFKDKIDHYRVDKILAFATSAIRDAANGNAFINQVKRDLKIEIAIIDGNQEADLIYLGVKEAVSLTEDISLIVDIGGGSTEFILANNVQVFWKQSFSIGAARLLERFAHSNPITKQEINNICEFLEDALKPLFKAILKHPPTEMIGSSGAFDSIIDMIHGEYRGEPLNDLKTDYEIDIEKYHQISKRITESSLEERKKIKGLIPMRFDMIVISCLMIDYIMKSLNLNRLRVSTYSLKEGALVDFINKTNDNLK